MGMLLQVRIQCYYKFEFKITLIVSIRVNLKKQTNINYYKTQREKAVNQNVLTIKIHIKN